MATSTKPVDALDVWKDAFGLLRACGPCGRGWIMSELITQTAGVTRENAAEHADRFIRMALERRAIEVYDPEATGNDVSYIPRIVETPLAARHAK